MKLAPCLYRSCTASASTHLSGGSSLWSLLLERELAEARVALLRDLTSPLSVEVELHDANMWATTVRTVMCHQRPPRGAPLPEALRFSSLRLDIMDSKSFGAVTVVLPVWIGVNLMGFFSASLHLSHVSPMHSYLVYSELSVSHSIVQRTVEQVPTQQ